jgi:hypothetical protein
MSFIGRSLGRDPEKWRPAFEKIMLKQKDSAGVSFNAVESDASAG